MDPPPSPFIFRKEVKLKPVRLIIRPKDSHRPTRKDAEAVNNIIEKNIKDKNLPASILIVAIASDRIEVYYRGDETLKSQLCENLGSAGYYEDENSENILPCLFIFNP